ncbi:hypothetical protein BDR04DRAFT_1151031 [Suillus decipiens]|nr:hypothetical protein BDR04DRAFT_1151031 [Suillus decipiens]
MIPPSPQPWHPYLKSNSSPNNIKDALTTQWAYETCPWFPLILANPHFDRAVFVCLNHLLYSLPIASTPDGHYILHKDVQQEWESLEQKLFWCQQWLAVNIHFPWYGQPPRPLRDYSYLRSHVNAKLAKKVAMRSHDVFLGISAIYTYFIMAHQYRPHNDLPMWTSLLMNDPWCPILPVWVMELSHTFVRDLTDAMPCNSMIINGAHSLAWDVDVIMFEHFKVPIWVHWPAGIPGNKAWKCYLPSADDVTAATHATSQNSNPWGAQLDLHPWLAQSNDALDLQNSDLWGTQLDLHPWLSQSNDALDPSAPSQQDLSHFLLPEKNSGQRHGKDWQAFFACRAMQNAKKGAKETPSQ